MRRWSLLLVTLVVLLVVLVCLGRPAFAETRLCGAAKDLQVQALERVQATSTPAQVRDANELLKRAAQMCSSLGDAWYYRSVFEARLGNVSGQQFALGRAKLIGSEAMDEGINPFELATPATATVFMPETGPKPVAQGTRWALVVGIGVFQDAHASTLRYAADDARLFSNALLDPATGGFARDNVRVLLDKDATTKNIKQSLNWIARQAKPEDLVVVYFATHGSARDMDSVQGINYLITSDTEGVAGEKDEDEDAIFASALPMIDVTNTVATRIHALRTAIFLDACHSGGAMPAEGEAPAGVGLGERTLEQISQGTGRIVMAAAKENQTSRESEQLQHGYFTYFLVKAMTDGKGSPKLGEVFTRVHDAVMTNVATDLKKFHARQEPVISRSSDGADFALGPVRAAAGKPGVKGRVGPA